MFDDVKVNRKVHHTKLVGQTWLKSQGIIRSLESDDELILEHEPDNPHDDKAIAIYAGFNKLGYLPVGFVQKRVHHYLTCKNLNVEVRVFVENLTGREHDNAGLNLRITFLIIDA